MPVEVCWLIERGQAQGYQATEWWQSLEDERSQMNYPKCWTNDANRARKFASKEVAQKYADSIIGGNLAVVEHVFL